MRLKIFTSVSLIVGIIFLFGWGLVLKMRPLPSLFPHEANQLKISYAGMYLSYLSVSIFSFVATASFSMLVAGEARENYRKEREMNLRELLKEIPQTKSDIKDSLSNDELK